MVGNAAAVAGGETQVVERQSGRAQVPTSRQLERDEIANLLRRGQSALQNGDFAAARLLLRRAAEAGNAQAALALAATYDPTALKELGALGTKADVAQARLWYRRAADAGSAEAMQRLQLIAQQSP
jgi:TPR repeat protein